MPGAVYYYLIGLPISIFQNISSVAWFEIILASTAMAAICRHLHYRVSKESGQLFCLLFLSSTFIHHQLILFWNPSYIFIFIAAAFILLDQKLNLLGWAIFGILIGASIQIHFSMALFLIAAAYIIFIGNDSLKSKLVNASAVAASLALTILPYLIFRAKLGRFGDPDFEFESALQRIIYKLQRALSVLIQFRADKLKDIAAFAVRDSIILVFLSSLVIAFKYKQKLSQYRPLIVSLAVYVPMLVFLLAGLYLLRYQIQFVFLAAIFSSILLGEAFKKSKIIKTAVLAVCALNLIYNMASRNYENISHLVGDSSSIVTTSEAIQIFKNVHAITNWDFDEFRKKTFRIGFDRDESWRLGYQETVGSIEKNSEFSDYDGLIIINFRTLGLKENFSQLSGLKQILPSLASLIPEEIYQAVQNDDLSCKEKLNLSEKYFMCFYDIKNKKKNVLWSNIGNSYFEVENKSDNGRYQPNLFNKANQTLRLRYNSCPQKQIACDIEFAFDFSDFPIISYSISGVPVGVVDAEHTAYRSYTLIEPQVLLACHDKNESHLLVSKIGLSNRGNENFLAPYSSEFKTNCKSFDDLKSLKVAVENGQMVIVSTITDEEFKPFEIEYAFQ